MIPSRFIAAVLCLAVAVPAVASTVHAQQTQAEVPEELKKIARLYNSYKDDEAYAACNEYLVSHPNAGMVVELRARCLRNLQRYDEAIQALKKLPTRTAGAKLLLAECLAVTKDGAAEAEQLVNEVAADDPNGVGPRVSRARVYMSTGKFREAQTELKYAVTLSPKNFEANLLAAQLMDGAGQFEQALQMYLPLVQHPENYETYDPHYHRDAALATAAVHVKLQQYDMAITLYQALAERFPQEPGYLLQLGIVQAVRYKFADSIATLEKAVNLAPKLGELHWRLGDLYRSQDRTDDAIAQFETLLALHDPKFDGLCALRLGSLYLDKGQLDKAKLHLETALTLAPDSPDVLEANGKLREKLGDVNGAKDAFRKAFAKNKMKFDALYHLAMLLSKSEDAAEQEEGARLLERHKKIDQLMQEIMRTKQEVDVNPTSWALNARLAALLNLAGEYEHAREWGERSLRLNPGPPAFVQMGYISANLKDWPVALKCFQQARKMLPPAKPGEKNENIQKLDSWIETLKKGEEITPWPMGELIRPAQKPGDAANAGGEKKEEKKDEKKADGQKADGK